MKARPPQILVLASSGTLAKFVVDEVVRSFGVKSLTISDHRENRLYAYQKQLAERYGKEPKARLVNVTSVESVESGTEHIDYVIVPISQDRPLVQEVCIRKGIVCIDLSVSEELIDSVLNLPEARNSKSLLLMAAGLFPGLSGIIANSIHVSNPEAVVDVGLLQSKDGAAGGIGIADMLQVFSRDVNFNTSAEPILKKGFSHLKAFEFGHRFGTKRLRLAHFIEGKYLQHRLNINSNYWSAFDSETLNKLIALLRKAGLLKLFENPNYRLKTAQFISKQRKDAPEEIIGVIGQADETNKVMVLLDSDYAATAACATAFVKLLDRRAEEEYGVFFPFEIFELDDVLRLIEHRTVAPVKS